MIPAIQIIDKKIEINPACKILKKKDYITYLNATDIIDSAQKQAQTIIEEAKIKYEQEKQRGYNDGVNASKVDQSEQNMEFVRKTISYLSNIENTIADIIIKGIKKIVGDLDTDKVALNLVKNVLKNVRNEKMIKVRISSDEYNYVNEHMQSITSEYKTVQFIDLVSDHRLKAGDCILESELGVIDSSLDIQIEALKRQFSKLNDLDTAKSEAQLEADLEKNANNDNIV
jgi:type III secretion protein L